MGTLTMKILMCGSRNWTDNAPIYTILQGLNVTHNQTITLVHGAAPGADSCAGNMATALGIPTEEYPARWTEEGRAAGPLRNQRMLDENPGQIHEVYAFRSAGKSNGTDDMVLRARAAGIPVYIITKAA